MQLYRPSINSGTGTVDEDDLVASGVIDSLAILQIVVYLETNHQLDVTAVDPKKLLSITGILSLLDR